MIVSELMSTSVKSCHGDDNLQRAAQLMWEGDCGVIPVVDGERRLVGMVTDRDVCMAAYTRGQALWAIPVSVAMSKEVSRVHESDRIEVAVGLMQSAHVHRVPVVDGDERLAGIVSIHDLVRQVQRSPGTRANGLSTSTIAQTLAAICEPHNERTQSDSP